LICSIELRVPPFSTRIRASAHGDLAMQYLGRAEQGYPIAKLRFHPSFISKLWTVNDRLAFHPDGTLLVGTITGKIVGVDLSDTSQPSGVWMVDDRPVLAIDVSVSQGVLATAGSNGSIKLWKLSSAAPAPRPDSKTVTQAFLDTMKPIDSLAADDDFRTTDGKRWYDFENHDEQELDDAPAWAQLEKWRRTLDLPDE
jgi:WD40 repeat protein